MREFEGKSSFLPETVKVKTKTCQELFKDLEERRVELRLEEWPVGRVLPVVGLKEFFGRSFYESNISASFKMGLLNEKGDLEEKTFIAVRFDSLEKPEGEGFVGFCILENEGTEQEYLQWCPQIPFFALAEDPGFTWIEKEGKREFVFNHVALNYFYDQEKHKCPKITTVFYTDDGTHNICHLRKLAEIPGKDNRLTDLGDGWKLLTSRPERITGERKTDGSFKVVKQIAFSLIGPDEVLNQQTIQRAYDEATVVEGFSAEDEWAGINDSHILPDNVQRLRLRGGVADAVPVTISIRNPFPDQKGKIISLCHRARFDDSDDGQKKVYLATIALWDRTDHRLILEDEVPVATRYDFPKTKVKINSFGSPKQLEMVAFLNGLELVVS